MLLSSNTWAQFGLELEVSSDTSSLGDTSSETSSSADSESSAAVGDSEVSSVAPVGSSDVVSSAPIVLGVSSYDDTQLIIGVSEINSRLERLNNNLEDNNVMLLWVLIIGVGVLFSYLFYSMAKKFI